MIENQNENDLLGLSPPPEPEPPRETLVVKKRNRGRPKKDGPLLVVEPKVYEHSPQVRGAKHPRINQTKLTSKQEKFIEAYKQKGEGYESAIEAGYSPKSAHMMAYLLLKHPKVKPIIDQWKAQKAEQADVTKKDFVDMALQDYRELEVTEPNKPRFLQIAGQALGHIGVNNQAATTNNLQINIVGTETPEQLWELTRKLLGNG